MADIIFAEQAISGFSYLSMLKAYVVETETIITFEIGKTYTVEWDNNVYECVAQDTDSYEEGSISIGNLASYGFSGNEEPFAIVAGAEFAVFISFDESETHTVAIYSGVLEEETPNEPTEETVAGANIVLFDRNGNEVTYEGIETVTFNTDVKGETATYTHGTTVSEVPVELDLSGGNQSVKAETGKLIKSVVIKKPETLLAENIKKGVEVAGIEGTLIGEGVSKTVSPDFSEGDMKVVPDAETLLSEVVIQKPEELVPENILDGVNIGGILGIHKDKIEMENMEIELDVSEGDQSISAPEGYVVKTAVIKKPETMIPENIKKNTSIAGVKGILNSIEDVVTAEEMNALLVEENMGNAYRFIGETTENYINGDIYVVEESV